MTSSSLSLASPEPPKYSLAFILDNGAVAPIPAVTSAVRSLRSSSWSSPSISSVSSEEEPRQAAPMAQLPPTHKDAMPRRSRDDRRRARACIIAGCPNYTIDHDLCFRHGGGKHCSIGGCSTSAKHRGLCWKHGGSTGCSVVGWTRGAKSKGLCWTHGGGKRCVFDGCKRPASKKALIFCVRHGAEVSQANYIYDA